MSKNIVSHGQRTLSVRKEHELLLKLEAAGLDDRLAQAVIGSKGNGMAKRIVNLIREGEPGAQRVTVSVCNSDSGGNIWDEPVSIVDPQGNVIAEDKTNGNGEAYFDLPPGEYEIRVAASSFGDQRKVRIPADDVLGGRRFLFGK